jgi:hypothetical protein
MEYQMRMERGMGLAGNGVGLLNGQTTKRDSITSEDGGGGLFRVNTAGFMDRGPRHQVDLGCVLKRQFLEEPQGVTSQKMAFFVVNAEKTSNLTYVLCKTS